MRAEVSRVADVAAKRGELLPAQLHELVVSYHNHGMAVLALFWSAFHDGVVGMLCMLRATWVAEVTLEPGLDCILQREQTDRQAGLARDTLSCDALFCC